MDKGQNDEAIALLKLEFSNRPSERTQILLASAYANRAGIKVESYWGFLIGYDSLLKGSKIFAENNDDNDADEIIAQLPSEVRSSMQELNSTLRELLKLRKRLKQIPLISENQKADIQTAINTLADTQSHGARLYRSILELILLRTTIENGYLFLSDFSKKPKIDCTKKMSQALSWIQVSTVLFQNFLSDFLLAFPTEEAEIKRLQSQSADLLENLSSFSNRIQEILCKK